MSTTIALAIIGIVILGITIFSFQFSNTGSVNTDADTGKNSDSASK